MKRLICLIICICVFLSGCSHLKKDNNIDNNKSKSSGVWITFNEINSLLSSEKGFETELAETVQNCKELKIQNVFIHIRSYCDSLFKSDYFPLVQKAQGLEFDVFERIITAFHNADIKVHGWINPYRVLTSSDDINTLRQDSPAYKWLTDENPSNDKNVSIKNGIYLNPAEAEVRELVLNGVREVINNYKVDGIHFDDYFYPTTDADFDSQSYEYYTSQVENPLSLDNWRRSNVNSLISGCYTAIKSINPDIIFSVSPAASIEKNYNELYADVSHWIENGYIDWIIPQLYFGFNYPEEDFQFDNILRVWKNVSKNNPDVQLHIGLANYKIGSSEIYDKEEWTYETDIIAKQVKICCEDKNVSGYIFFSYSSLFSTEKLHSIQRQNYKDYLNSR